MESEKKLKASDLIQEIYFLSYQPERIPEYFWKFNNKSFVLNNVDIHFFHFLLNACFYILPINVQKPFMHL